MSSDTVIAGPEDLGALIRNRRREQRLTQTQLADMADVSVVFVNEIEHGKPTAQIGRVLRVLQALGTDIIARAR